MFRLDEHGTTWRAEGMAGVTTFLTMSYIIFVNPQILSGSGMDKGAVTAATCLAAAVSTVIMGLWANIPVAQAPGMGLNAFFTYTVCMAMNVPWPKALGVVFLSGVLNVILTWTNVREMVVRAIPAPLKRSIAIGIGLFLALIGCQHMGLVAGHPVTLVTVGDLSRPATLLSLAGLALMAVLLARNVRAAFLIGILVISAVAFATGLSPRPSAIVGAPPSLSPTFFQLDILSPLRDPKLWGVILAFMFVDLFDSVGTLLAVGYAAKLVKTDGEFPQIRRALQADAVATPIGALLGTSSTTSYIESAAGAESGGRTGATSLVCGVLFLAGLFVVPLVTAVPPFATAPVLVLVGFLMMSEIVHIRFSDVTEGLPAFVTLILMPLTYSISIGLGFGFMTYLLLMISLGRFREIHPILYPVCALFLFNLAMA